jgi:hypothetical protein
MGLILNERIDTLALARKETFRDVGAAGESDGIKALRSASPELVRRTVIEAASAWPELEGVKVTLASTNDRPAVWFPPDHKHGNWGEVRTDTLTNLREDAAKLAESAALAVRAERAKVCQECVRWDGPPRSGTPCGTCGSINAAERAAMLDAIEREIEREIEGEAASVSEADFVVPLTADDWNRVIGRTMRDGQAADAVTIEYESAPYAGFSRGKVELSVEKQRKGPTGTVRLGLPHEIESGPTKPASERTPLPVRWTWDEVLIKSGALWCDGPGDSWAALGSDFVVTRDNSPAPPAIHNAIVTEAARIGMLCHVQPMTAPEGYEFDVEDHGVFCRMRAEWSSGLNVCSYFRPEHPEVALNADPGRWAGHEPARQWAAYLLGEVAPPLRKETR